jgi:glycosyltransferase involved in cell wall biosynthesis
MAETPRVLYCTDTYPPQLNGVSVVTELSVHGLRTRGWEVATASPRYPDGTADVIIDAREPTGHRNALLVPSVGAPIYPDIRLAAPAVRAVARLFDRFRPDIVHCATEFMIGWMGQREARRREIPVVSSYHTDFSRYAAAYGVPWLRGSVSGYLCRFHRRSARVYTPGLAAQGELHAMGVRDVEVWGRGVDTAIFHPERRDELLRAIHAPQDAFIFLHVGRLAAEKGVERILEAYRLARERLPEGRAVRLIIAGDGPRLPALRDMATPDVTFLGNLHRTTALPQLYASADAFLFASHTETLGLVILEAMASGVPVIAAPAGGVADHLRHGINGLAYPPGDVEAMAGAMVRLANGPELNDRLRRGARATAMRRTWGPELDRLGESYTEVIGARASQRGATAATGGNAHPSGEGPGGDAGREPTHSPPSPTAVRQNCSRWWGVIPSSRSAAMWPAEP